MKNSRTFVAFIFSLLLFYGISAQDAPAVLPLAEILTELQDRYGYQFNYASESIEGVTVLVPSEDLSFREALVYLQQETGLVFSILNNQIVSIKTPDLVLCGYLKDKDTRQPIVSATVQSTENSVVTDETGFFKLALEEANEIIRIRHLGHKMLVRAFPDFRQDLCGDIYLLADQQRLPEIVLTDYLVEGIDKLNDGSFKIDFSRFTMLPGLTESDVLQSIQAFPGIQSINETVSNINIRGGTHDQNLILWDDIKMYQSGHFFGLISMFNPHITQRVSLRKNGTGVAYTDGVSGTISMATEKNINKSFKGNIGVNFTDASGFADIPLGKNSSVQIAARKAISDFFETPTYTEYFDRISQDTEVETNVTSVRNSDIQFDFYDTSLRWLFEPSEKDVLQVNFINSTNELVFDESGAVNNIESTRQSSLTQNSIAAGLQYHRTWTDRLQTSLNVYETDYKLKSVNANILSNQRFLQENVVSETGVRLQSTYSLYDKIHLLSGYHFVETKIKNLDDVDDPVFRRLTAEVVRTHGVFSQLNYTSENTQTSFNAGLRFNYIDKFKKQLWEPRLSFNQRFLNDFNLEILGEFKHQNTSQIINFQNDFLGIEKRRWQLSNDADVPVIKSKQISAGLSYTKNGWLINAVSYYKKVDGITAQSQGFQNQYEFVRANGGYDAVGIDVLLRKQLNGFNAWLSYSFLDSEFIFETFPEKTFPSNLDITHSVSIGSTYRTEQLTLSAGLNWRSGRPTTEPLGGNELLGDAINFGPSNAERLEDYMRVDISAMYKFSLGGSTRTDLGLSFWNLLDRENNINNFYRLNALGMAEEVVQSSLGITPNAVLRFYF